jgi:hypothetical protein
MLAAAFGRLPPLAMEVVLRDMTAMLLALFQAVPFSPVLEDL